MYENMPYFCLLGISSLPHYNFVAIYSRQFHDFTKLPIPNTDFSRISLTLIRTTLSKQDRQKTIPLRAATANFWQARPPQWRPHQPPLPPPPLSILQIPGKAQALGALPAMAALLFGGTIRATIMLFTTLFHQFRIHNHKPFRTDQKREGLLFERVVLISSRIYFILFRAELFLKTYRYLI